MAASKSFNDLLKQPPSGPMTTPKATPRDSRNTTPKGSPKRKITPALSPSPKRPVFQAPARLPPRPSPKLQPPPFAGWSGVRVRVYGMPEGWGTWDVYEHLSAYGNLSRIEIFARRGGQTQEGYVIFRPPPQVTKWIITGLDIYKSDTRRHLDFRYEQLEDRNRTADSASCQRLPESITVSIAHLDAGVMRKENEMTSLFSSTPTTTAPLSLIANAERKWLDLMFGVPMARLRHGAHDEDLAYKLSTDLSNIRSVRKLPAEDGGTVLLVELAMPPMLYRRTSNIHETHEQGVLTWNEQQAWFRQTGIDVHPDHANEPTQLCKEAAILEVGRWLTYRLQFSDVVASSSAFDMLGQVLTNNNVRKSSSDSADMVKMTTGQAVDLWTWTEGSINAVSTLHFMDEVRLDFDVRYQLEVCLSQGVLHECNIHSDFIRKLATLEPARAAKLLAKVADEKKRFFNAMDVFQLVGQISAAQKKPPRYCALIRGAIITPTTIHFATPVLETSNRVIRDYRHLEDRFLRVKFTDERYKGRVMNGEDETQNEVYTRIKRTMQNGIRIGDRHYDFLAFGNSQFRENGAYFFASAGPTTAASIRDKMGNFTKIRDEDRNVAKYASRLGQPFSTTRGMSGSVKIEKLDDISRNGDCFTDGVGKISPFLAQTIASELNLPNPWNDYPSVFQFRLGGCKGVLAVDPAMKGRTVQIRPSQEKFPAPHYGLEVCRYSKFLAAHLNVQIILVLNARGVQTEVFLRKMRKELSAIEEALSNEKVGADQLREKTDFNQMTLVLADMIDDGFMEKSDPFFTSCLRLWRSWMHKYLKEKSKLPIHEGALVFGCIDETATLNGHFHSDHEAEGELTDKTVLPEIFIQIKDPKTEQYKIIEGTCTLARNPSLHPGDVRFVRAIDTPALHHLKDCVVLPQTGDRGLASMCSGGDLDGDDYLVMWDKELLPTQWNYPPMEYNAPPPKRSDGPVTVDDLATHFVTHMRKDNLGRIATAHRYLADSKECPQGVKDEKCVELARLHSMAVDYAKTGVPAEFPKALRIKIWPHWAERHGKPSYRSRKVLGRLYDEVQRVPFLPEWDVPFDSRILGAYQLDEGLLQDAREIKMLYDEAVRRIMAQYSIHSEFEIWTTFVLSFSSECNDYKLAERLGETVMTLKQRHQELCYETAGTTPQERDWVKIAPFIAAMYTVTANEVSAASKANKQSKLVAGQYVPVKQSNVSNMPFMSFPWIFAEELGHIAKRRTPGSGVSARQGATLPVRSVPTKKQQQQTRLESDDPLEPLPEVTAAGEVIHEGDVLNVHHQSGETVPAKNEKSDKAVTPASSSGITQLIELDKDASGDIGPPCISPDNATGAMLIASYLLNSVEEKEAASIARFGAKEAKDDTPSPHRAAQVNESPRAGDEELEEPEEEVILENVEMPSTLDALGKLVGL